MEIKLYKEDLEFPSWMRNRQYLHDYDYPDVKVMTDRVIDFFDQTTQNLIV